MGTWKVNPSDNVTIDQASGKMTFPKNDGETYNYYTVSYSDDQGCTANKVISVGPSYLRAETKGCYLEHPITDNTNDFWFDCIGGFDGRFALASSNQSNTAYVTFRITGCYNDEEPTVFFDFSEATIDTHFMNWHGDPMNLTVTSAVTNSNHELKVTIDGVVTINIGAKVNNNTIESYKYQLHKLDNDGDTYEIIIKGAKLMLSDGTQVNYENHDMINITFSWNPAG